ncbi:hypothetical protein ACGFZL_27510 [Streptomyces sp. NPDC048182]|uniref:hypothetical protein n=1 Tax=unclassified Streptomyces TaxID=2593676 RepID=UPI0033A70E65
MFAVETMTTDGMHEIVRIRQASADGAAPDADPPPLGTAERAELHTTVRAHLDLMGHQAGPALTEVLLSSSGTRILRCRLRGL